jgi:hypothetical protein
MKIRSTNRTAFTIVEMMVATALTLFIMAVITTVFRAGTDTFSKLRAAGSLSEKLQHSVGIIKRDLGSQHFNGPFSSKTGPFLSDQRMDLAGWQPPSSGYFEIIQEPSILPLYNGTEGANDADTLWSSRSTVSRMRFTVKLNVQRLDEQFAVNMPNVPGSPNLFAYGYGNEPNSVFAPSNAPLNRSNGWFPDNKLLPFAAGTYTPDRQIGPYVQGNTMFSPWAEVAYYLTPTGDTTVGASPLPLYTLRRKERVLSPTGTTLPTDVCFDTSGYLQSIIYAANSVASHNKVLVGSTGASAAGLPRLTIQGPERVTLPTARLFGDTFNVATTLGASDDDTVLMVNVISFEIKAMWISPTSGAYVSDNRGRPLGADPVLGIAANNSDGPYDNLPPMPHGSVTPYTYPGTAVWNYASPPASQLVTASSAFAGNRRVFDTWFNSPSGSPRENPNYETLQPPVTGSLYPFNFFQTNLPQERFNNVSPPMTAPVYVDHVLPNPPYPAGTVKYYQPPLRINIRAIQIKIRIWDEKSQQTRQLTFVQEV